MDILSLTKVEERRELRFIFAFLPVCCHKQSILRWFIIKIQMHFFYVFFQMKSQRELPQEVISDNGTDFGGASSKLSGNTD